MFASRFPGFIFRTGRRRQVPSLRPYQITAREQIYEAWQSVRYVLLSSPTGSGKTVLFSAILAEVLGGAVAIAHRQELVSQISLALARCGVSHTIIGPRHVARFIVQLHIEELGRSYYDPGSSIAVAGVDTLIRRQDELRVWSQQVRVWVLDEGHHLLRGNKWGEAARMFPNARGLGVTATPERADGKGLGIGADGFYERLIRGPSMRHLIPEYLTDYRIFCPASDIDLTDVPVSQTTGDYSTQKLIKAARRSHIVGDVVEHYKRHAAGQLGITFVTDVETAVRTAEEYTRSGVPAAAVSAKTADRERTAIVRRYRRRELLQLVNVDLFGEGFDLPAIECVSMARPTHSYPLFVQQFGRGLRPMEGKTHATIIDHVGNVIRHGGPPDFPRSWSLERREKSARKKKDPDAIPLRACSNCTSPYQVIYKECPYCGHPWVAERRDGPEYVDGDLVELDAATLAVMRDEIARIDEDPRALRARVLVASGSHIAAAGAANKHRARQDAQAPLRKLIELWAGVQRARGREDSESYRRFYHRYGIDVASAQALGRNDANSLSGLLIDDIRKGAA